ncbi:hypothetical protein Calab_2482 [Caldithrix abyssi DSM 13497]|uniref:Membrane protein involved in the export of O-antigen and teichoic acid n=1 Tax=Caldithrix abyssi DSM 13497 TaxID=880073 RepID=H1XZ21_CALAY|nr:hypothetical protein [Caldithrix abyssi]APF18045.1 hypothetical protein Cabys_1296 [Caldithrix abyssi DSM 13497]EHO42092.1 hypothetical protein Calab_2482 [Caldithrix abyssi DSM 13497]
MEQRLTLKRIFVFWYPLSATWLMMALEGPFIAAIIARLPEPKYNLAAYGVAFAFALIVEAPVIMMLSASTALVKDRISFVKLKRFVYWLNGLITALMLVILIPDIFYFLAVNLMELPQKVAVLTHGALWILLPWPATIGYRRFYQGLLIRHNLTRRVAYGTVIRLTSMIIAGLSGALIFKLPGAYVGALALSTGVTVEALASRLMTWQVVKSLQQQQETEETLTYRSIVKFYYPLALTSLIALAVQPMITFFLGQSRMALESLAVLPVINSLVFIFRSFGLSFQEVGITFLGQNNENFKLLLKFALLLMGFVTGSLVLIGFTPLHDVWFFKLSGLNRELTDFARIPVRILSLLPAMSVLLSFQRSILVTHRKTGPITSATVIEVGLIALSLFVLIKYFDWIGAVAAALALMIGRSACNLYLLRPVSMAVRKHVV